MKSQHPTLPSPAAPSTPASVPAAAAGALASTLSSSLPVSVQPPAPEAPGKPEEATKPVEPPTVPHVQVSAVEYGFSLSRTSVPAGKVMLQFVNDGQDEHNLKLASPEGPLVGSFASEPAKGVSNLELEIQPGSYTLFCSLPQHEQKGMKATLLVE